MVHFPEQYEEICKSFIKGYYRVQREALEDFFSIYLPNEYDDFPYIFDTPIAHMLATIAEAADEKYKPGPDACVTMTIHGFMETLFAIPMIGDLRGFEIPDNFWDTEIGKMILQANHQMAESELITQIEAAKILDVSIQHISQLIKMKKLRSVINPNAPNPQRGRKLVYKSEIKELSKKRQELNKSKTKKQSK